MATVSSEVAACCTDQSDSKNSNNEKTRNEEAILPPSKTNESPIPIGSDNSKNESGNNISSTNDNNNSQKKTKRVICPTCSRPAPRACVCAALPTQRIQLQQCTVIVLQHPHEVKLKNRSLPLIELCLDPASIHLVTGRRFGDENVTETVRNLLSRPNVMLMYPVAKEDEETLGRGQAVDFSQALEIIDQRRRQEKTEGKTQIMKETSKESSSSSSSLSSPNSNKITVILLDATWKFASEMHQANIREKQYPDHMLYVSLTPTMQAKQQEQSALVVAQQPPQTELVNDNPSFNNDKDTLNKQNSESTPKDGTNEAHASFDVYKRHVLPEEFKPRRFEHVRTPPTDDCLSTAECLAWVVSAIEETFQEKRNLPLTETTPKTTAPTTRRTTDEESIYETLMKPLDLMAEQWKSFTDNHGGPKVRESFGKRQKKEKKKHSSTAPSKRARCDPHK